MYVRIKNLKTPDKPNTLYRCHSYGGLYGIIFIRFREYSIVKQTEYFYVIRFGRGVKRVGIGSKKAFARPTKKEALKDFYYRKQMEYSHLYPRTKKVESIINYLKDRSKNGNLRL